MMILARYLAQGRQGAARAAVALAMLALTTSLPAPLAAQSYSFDGVVVQGNSVIDAKTILKLAQIPRNTPISAARLNDSLQRVNESGLFQSVEYTPKGQVLTIRVTELPIIGRVDFQGNKRLKDEDLSKVVTSQGLKVFSPATAEKDAAAIAEFYTARGRLAASVVPKIIPRGAGRVDLVFEIDEGRVVENESIDFVGNRAFSDRRLRQVLQTKQAGLLRELIRRDTFDAERLELDKQLLRDFYLSRGFADVQVVDASADLARERDASFVVYTLREGPQYKFGALSIDSQIADLDLADFTAALRLRQGQVYSPLQVEGEIARLEAIALRKGLNFVQVEPRVTRHANTQSIDLQLILKRGERIFVERIDIEGNTTTLDQVIRRQFKAAEGDAFNPREIREAAERIRALGFFASAEVAAAPGASQEQVVVNVDLEEAPTGALSFGVTYGTNNGAGIALGYSETNLLGRGQSLDLNVTTSSDTQDWTFAFGEPSLLGRNVKFKLGANYKKTTQASARYNTDLVSVTPALEFPLGEMTRLELRYRYASETVVNVSSTSSVVKAEAARGAESTSALGYTLNFDTRNQLGAQGGVLLRFSQDFAGLGGAVKYISTKALGVAETQVLGEEVTLRAVAEGGVISALDGYKTRVTDRFFGGGIRGFERNGIGPREAGDALGGNMFASLRLEAEFPLGLPEEYGLTGGAYLDTGAVWGLDQVGTAQGVDQANRVVGGVALLWNTPIGPLRMNFSRQISQQSFDIPQSFELTLSTKF
jgi:outer membrane protein insertion porin family